jgi:hypothetical protein
MSLLLYAITENSAEPVDGAGLEQRPLRALSEDQLVAIVSEHLPSASGQTEQQLLQYEQVIESLMSRHAILPARFGSRFENEAELRAMVRARREHLASAVARVRGAVEISLSASWRESASPAAPEARSGTAYMLDRVEQHQRASALALQLQSLDEIARASSYRLLVKPSVPVLVAYLVDRDRVEDFAAAVRTLDERLDGVELICTGPWPPYSFTDGAAS